MTKYKKSSSAFASEDFFDIHKRKTYFSLLAVLMQRVQILVFVPSIFLLCRLI
jgi:hypothetical protein